MSWPIRRNWAFGSDAELLLEKVTLAVGSLESRAVRTGKFADIRQAEFRVFSQFGEDGIIQYLLGRVAVENEVFIEFGVEDYRESNTRFLLVHDNWRGLIIDGGTAHIAYLSTNPIMWRHWIEAESRHITCENVNELIAAHVSGDIGLLSIDIDGNDYWVLEAVEEVSPRILIVEYNSIFGRHRAVTIPYRPDFDRRKAHYSHLYWGASLGAICFAAEQKGYEFVGSNSAGNNAFFVRRDVIGNLRVLKASEGWVESRFRESRGPKGELTFLSTREERLGVISDLPLVDVTDGSKLQVSDLLSDEQYERRSG